MAKKKAATSTKSKAAKQSAGKSSAKSAGAKTSKPKAAAKKSAATTKPAMCDEAIGNTAGEVWHSLSTGGGQTLATLKKSVDASPELVLAAVGWLAREGKLDFVATGRTLKVALR